MLNFKWPHFAGERRGFEITGYSPRQDTDVLQWLTSNGVTHKTQLFIFIHKKQIFQVLILYTWTTEALNNDLLSTNRLMLNTPRVLLKMLHPGTLKEVPHSYYTCSVFSFQGKYPGSSTLLTGPKSSLLIIFNPSQTNEAAIPHL